MLSLNFLDFAKSCLVKNHLSLAFISQVTRTCTYLGVVVNNRKRRLEKVFPSVRNFTLHRQCLWKESKSSERDFLFKSEADASKFSRGDNCVFLDYQRRRKDRSPK